MIWAGLILLTIWTITWFVIRGIYLSARKVDGQGFPLRLPKE